MTAPLAEMLDRLPHRPPFRFVTDVTSLTPGEQAAGTWSVRGDEAWLQGHFPGQPIVPGVLIAEALAQLSGLVVVPAEGGHVVEGRLAQVDVKITGAVTPPADIALRSSLTRVMGSIFQFDVVAEYCGQRVVKGSLVLSDVSART